MALVGGTVLTMCKAKPCAEAVAIKGDCIIKVGSNREVQALIGKSTRVIELEGKAVLPGFVDTHVHVVDFGRLLMWLDLAGTASIVEMQERLKERLQKTAKGKWIIGRGWDDARFAEKRLPNRFDLDAVAPNNPVVFYYMCGPVCVVNSKALQLAGITKATPNPKGGTIDKDPKTGEPTGILRDAATDLVYGKIPEPSLDELVDASALALRKMSESGLTGIHWLATSKVDLEVLQKLVEKKLIPVRIYMVVPLNLLDDLPAFAGLQNELVRFGGVEVIADGYLSSGSAALFEPYTSDKVTNGKLLTSPAELKTAIEKISKAGLQLVIHAMGDKAIAAALTAIESSKTTGRHRIDQSAIFNKELIARAKALGVVVSVQPIVGESEFTVYFAMEHLGEKRARWLYPLKTLFREGLCVCGGSDCPMEPLPPLLAIQSAVTRKQYPQEQLTVDEALQMYTANAAYATGEETEKGTIQEGKIADLTILSKNPRQIEPNKISDIPVKLKIILGKTCALE